MSGHPTVAVDTAPAVVVAIDGRHVGPPEEVVAAAARALNVTPEQLRLVDATYVDTSRQRTRFVFRSVWS